MLKEYLYILIVLSLASFVSSLGYGLTQQEADAAVDFWNNKIKEAEFGHNNFFENYNSVLQKERNDLDGYAAGLRSLQFHLNQSKQKIEEARQNFARLGIQEGVSAADNNINQLNRYIYDDIDTKLRALYAKTDQKFASNKAIIDEMEQFLRGKEDRSLYAQENLKLLQKFDKQIPYTRILNNEGHTVAWTEWKINHELEYCRTKFNALMGEVRRMDGSNLKLLKTLNDELRALDTKAKGFLETLKVIAPTSKWILEAHVYFEPQLNEADYILDKALNRQPFFDQLTVLVQESLTEYQANTLESNIQSYKKIVELFEEVDERNKIVGKIEELEDQSYWHSLATAEVKEAEFLNNYQELEKAYVNKEDEKIKKYIQDNQILLEEIRALRNKLIEYAQSKEGLIALNPKHSQKIQNIEDIQKSYEQKLAGKYEEILKEQANKRVNELYAVKPLVEGKEKRNTAKSVFAGAKVASLNGKKGTKTEKTLVRTLLGDFYKESNTPVDNRVGLLFGDIQGGDKLFQGQKYQFKLTLPTVKWKNLNNAQDLSNTTLRIKVFHQEDIEAGNLPEKPLAAYDYTLPVVPWGENFDQNSQAFKHWGNFYLDQSNGLIQLKGDLFTKYGLEACIEYASYDFKNNLCEVIITHRANNPNYYFVVEAKEIITSGRRSALETDPEKPLEASYVAVYSLNFSQRPVLEADYISRPSFYNPAQPSPYNRYLPSSNKNTFSASATGGQRMTQAMKPTEESSRIDHSAELRSHPDLDKLISSYEGDPIALASYVLNEIELIQGSSLPRDAAGQKELLIQKHIQEGSGKAINIAAIYSGIINRGALGTLLEKQGTPWEQCALLVYALRKAGYKAAYAEIGRSGKLAVGLDTLSKMLKMQMQGYEQGRETIPLNYPWVVVYDEKKQEWAHIFPWLKDIEIIEGLNIEDYLPCGSNNAQEWITKYLQNDPAILKHVQADKNDTAFRLFEAGVKEKLNEANLSIEDIGVRYNKRARYLENWNDFPKPEVFEGEFIISENIANREELFSKVQVEMFSEENPTKKIATVPMNYAEMHHRALYTYCEPLNSEPNCGQHWMTLCMNGFTGGITPTGEFTGDIQGAQLARIALDETDKNISIRVTFDGKLEKDIGFTGVYNTSNLKQHEEILSIQKGVTASICIIYGRSTSEMVKLYTDEYKASKASYSQYDSQGLLCCRLGSSYYNKITTNRKAIRELYKLIPSTTFGVGLAKLSPEYGLGAVNISKEGHFMGVPDLCSAQVDMKFYGYDRYANNTVQPSLKMPASKASYDGELLCNVDGSSWEHQILNDIFDGDYSVSTVKLLQLAHKRHEARGGRGPGYLVLTCSTLKDFIAGQLEGFKNVDQITRELGSQWKALLETFAYDSSTGLFNLENEAAKYAIAYITPGKVHSDDGDINDSNKMPSYFGCGAFIFSPYKWHALISGNNMYNMNGAFMGGRGHRFNIGLRDNGRGQPRTIHIEPERPKMQFHHMPPDHHRITRDYLRAPARMPDMPAPVPPPVHVNIAGNLPEPKDIFIPLDTSIPTEKKSILAAKLPDENTPKSLLELQEEFKRNTPKQLLQQYTNDLRFSSIPIQLDRELQPKEIDTARIFSDIQDKGRLKAEFKTASKGIFNSVADPVDVVTGAFYIDAIDLSIAGNPEIVLKRQYNSRNSLPGDFGHGWRHNYTSYLDVHEKEDGKLYIHAMEPDGSVLVYAQEAESSIWKVDLAQNPEIEVFPGSGNSWENARIEKVVDPEGTKYIHYLKDGSIKTYKVRAFPINGLMRERPYLISLQDTAGNKLEFIYGENSDETNPEELYNYGHLVKIKNDSGLWISFKYNKQGYIAEAQAKGGRKVSYDYDEFGDLVKVTHPDGAFVAYTYEKDIDNENEANVFYSKHRLVKEEKPGGWVLENLYDLAGRVIQQNTRYGFTNQTEHHATFVYEVPGPEVEEAQDKSITLVKDPHGSITEYRIYKGKIYKIIDPEGNTIEQTWYITANTVFDPTEEKLKPTEEKGQPFKLKQTKDKRGLIVAYDYDANGNIIAETIKGEDLTGTGVQEHKKSFKHEQVHPFRLLEEHTVNSDGKVHGLKYTYDEDFIYQPKTISTFVGEIFLKRIEYAYGKEANNRGKAVEEVIYDRNSMLLSKVKYEYDQKGLLAGIKRQIDASGSEYEVKYKHNTMGLCEEELLPSGDKIVHAYDTVGKTLSTYVMDKKGIQLKQEHNYYYENGQLKWKQGTHQNPLSTTFYFYDKAGKVVSTVESQAQYDLLTRSLKSIEQNHPFKGYFTIYQWDKLGSLTKKINPRGIAIEYEYDKLTRLSKVQDNGREVSYEYEKGGLLKKQSTNWGAEQSFSYTTQGRKIIHVHENGSVTNWKYDLLGRVLYEEEAGYITRYKYKDEEGKVITTSGSLTTVEEYDALGRIVHYTDSEGGIYTYKYNYLGDLIEESNPEKEVTKYTYNYAGNSTIKEFFSGDKEYWFKDALGRIIEITLTDAKGMFVETKTYTYSAEGYIEQETKGKGIDSGNTRTVYDQKGRLIARTIQNGESVEVESFKYDGNGNLIQHQDFEGNVYTYVYDEHDQCISEIRPDGSKVEHVYDTPGNPIITYYPRGLTHYTQYNPQTGEKQGERLVEVPTLGGPSKEYTYNKNSILIEKIDERGIVFKFQYDENKNLTHIQASTGEELSYTYDNNKKIKSIHKKLASGETVLIEHSYDTIGRLLKEDVYLGETLHQSCEQKWSENTRKSLSIQAAGQKFEYEYGYTSAGKLAQVNCPSIDYILNYSYNLRGQMQSWKDNYVGYAIDQYTADGRLPAAAKTILKGTEILDETLTWQSDKLIKHQYQLLDEDFEHIRNYAYNRMGRLTSQTTQHRLIISKQEDYIDAEDCGYDSLGILQEKHLLSYISDRYYKVKHQVGNKVCVETVADSEKSKTCYNSQKDALKEALEELKELCGEIRQEDIARVYDEAGNVTSILDGKTGKAMELTWNAWNELEKVEAAGEYIWEAMYDGLGRRLKTSYTKNDSKNGKNKKGLEAFKTYLSYYDPEVEFLEIGLSYEEELVWKVYGVDLNGEYGGLQGIGGLQLVAKSSTKRLIKPIKDLQGHILGVIIAGQLVWEGEASYDGYGPLVGKAKSIEKYTQEHEQSDLGLFVIGSSQWRGRRLDVTGLIWQGTRYYEPRSGRFISPDPYGHEGSIDLYSYANGDPITFCDPDGRYANAVYEKAWENRGEIGSFGADYLPGIGTAKGVYEAWSGYDPIAKRQLDVVDRVLSGVGAIPVVGGTVKRAGKAIRLGVTAAEVIKKVEKVGLPNPYSGIQKASIYLQNMQVSRTDRIRILQSFETENIIVRQATEAEFGLRYFSDPLKTKGSYLFETFPASRSSLAVKPEWNSMTGFKQFQIRPGTTILEGKAAKQGEYLQGGQIQKFILNWEKDLKMP